MAPSAPLLSVVVPVYNTEAYLPHALGSLAPSEGDNLEIIVVHDGGSDRSLRLACDWAEETHLRVLVLDQPNRGLSAARMAGVDLATGSAIAFLDSDDVVDSEVLMRIAHDLDDFECDVVLARSAVLDSSTLECSPFYDASIWSGLVNGELFRRTTVARDPALLRLEPNANTRVIRRSFMEREGIDFPLGRVFEDPPAHVRALVRANAIGIRNELLYLYRVNRVGKITDERSSRRFDALATTSEALDIAATAGVSDAAGANLLVASCRLLFWCCEHVANADRANFAVQASRVFSGVPAPWRAFAMESLRLDVREALIVASLLHGDSQVIGSFAARRWPPFTSALRFTASRFGGPARQLAREKAWRLLRSFPNLAQRTLQARGA